MIAHPEKLIPPDRIGDQELPRLPLAPELDRDPNALSPELNLPELLHVPELDNVLDPGPEVGKQVLLLARADDERPQADLEQDGVLGRDLAALVKVREQRATLLVQDNVRRGQERLEAPERLLQLGGRGDDGRPARVKFVEREGPVQPAEVALKERVGTEEDDTRAQLVSVDG